MFNFLQSKGITSVRELFDKIAAMNGDYYDRRSQIVSKERRLSVLKERLEMWSSTGSIMLREEVRQMMARE